MTPQPGDSSVGRVEAGDHVRFACHNCAACCRNWRVTVRPDEVARFAGHGWVAEDARFGAGFLDRRIRDDGSVELELRKIAGACIFLDDDNLCRIQKRLGAAAKPDLCRLFPLALVRRPDGRLEASVVPECESWHRSYRDGPPLPEGAIADVPDPLAEVLVVPAPPALKLRDGGPLIFWDAVRALTRRLGEALAAAPSLEAALATWPATLRDAAFAGRRASARRQAEADAAAATAAAAPPPDPAAFAEAVEAALRALEGPFAVAARRLLSPGGAWRGAFAELPPETLDYLRAILRAWLDGPTLAQAKLDLEAALGFFVAFAHLLAARALVVASGAGHAAPTPADLSIAAKDLSPFLREPGFPDFVRRNAASFRTISTTYSPPAAHRV